MKIDRVTHLFLFIVLILVFSSCHPRHASDIKLNMTKEEVVSLWKATPLVTYKTVDGNTVETWEYHFMTTDSICLITFSQERVVATECHRQQRYYYAYPYYPYYYPYPFYYPYYYPYRYPYHHHHHRR